MYITPRSTRYYCAHVTRVLQYVSEYISGWIKLRKSTFRPFVVAIQRRILRQNAPNIWSYTVRPEVVKTYNKLSSNRHRRSWNSEFNQFYNCTTTIKKSSWYAQWFVTVRWFEKSFIENIYIRNASSNKYTTLIMDSRIKGSVGYNFIRLKIARKSPEYQIHWKWTGHKTHHFGQSIDICSRTLLFS